MSTKKWVLAINTATSFSGLIIMLLFGMRPENIDILRLIGGVLLSFCFIVKVYIGLTEKEPLYFFYSLIDAAGILLVFVEPRVTLVSGIAGAVFVVSMFFTSYRLGRKG